MSKLYPYKNLQYTVQPNVEYFFSVELISDGNVIDTGVNVPDWPPEKDPLLHDEDSASIGMGADLVGKTLYVFSYIRNLIPQEDQITVNYRINGDLVQAHNSPKSEGVRVFVSLDIKFV